MSESTFKKYFCRRARGFTLIELMVTLAVIGVLISLALPAFRSFVEGQRIKNASFDLMSMINLARSEAIKRNTNVTLNLDTATNTFKVTALGVATPIRKQEMFTGISVNYIDVSTHAVASWPTAGIVYSGNGRLVSAFGPLQIGSTDTTNVNTRCISLDLSGRPNSKKGNC